FKDLQKVWNEEKNQVMYVFDQEAINRMISRRARGVRRIANVNEWGLMIIAGLTSIGLLVTGNDGAYKILAAVTMLATGAYVWWLRRRRLHQVQRVAHSVREELEEALANARYLVRFAQTFAYWFLLPTAGVTLFRMAQKETSLIYRVAVIGCFAFSYILVQLELRWKHRPRLRRLEELQEKFEL
ncbi:MAG: hypothetical protein AAFN81_25040, partial [Bacteroidota bacterium]